MALKVQDQSPEVEAMAANWPIVDALLGGTPAMRAAGPAFLPQWPAESDDSYKARKETATLFPAFERTLAVMSGKPFSKQLTLGDDVPPKLVKWLEDVDLQGNSAHSVCADIMNEAMGYGLCGVLVDYPKVGGRVRTQADEKKLGVRPYWVFIRHSQILGWQAENVGGVTRLTQLRIAESKNYPDGLYGVVSKKRVRVLSPGFFEVWEEGAKPDDPWTLVVLPTKTTLDAIPFVPFYGKKKGYMCGTSPLLNLAHLNVKHWQSQSDQDTILHVARVPILAMIGVDAPAADGSGGSQLEVGAAAVVRLPQGSDMKYVEHSGKAISAGEQALEKLEDQMVTTGAELLVVKPGEQKSATQSNNDAEGNKCDLQRMSETFEDSLDQVLQLMAKWVKEAQGGHASLFKDFGAATLSDASAHLVVELYEARLLSRQTAIREQQRRGMLAADIDPKAELKAIDAEPAPTVAPKPVPPV